MGWTTREAAERIEMPGSTLAALIKRPRKPNAETRASFSCSG